MAKSDIEWTGFTWNPTKGCSLNCFAMRHAYRLDGVEHNGMPTVRP
jgi:protein gp37